MPTTIQQTDHIELRWVTPPHTTTKSPVLQIRQAYIDSQTGYFWGEWADVPLVVVSPTDTQPADPDQQSR